MSDWTIRAVERDDEGCILDMWMRQLLRESFSPAERPQPGSPEHIRFWREAQPVLEGVLRSRAIVRVACDAERSSHADGPAIIAGWFVADEERVYGIGIKRALLAPGAEEIAADLLVQLVGETMLAPRKHVMRLFDLERLGAMPSAWRRDDDWLHVVAGVSRATLADDVTADVVSHITDPRRPRWVPREQRAA